MKHSTKTSEEYSFGWIVALSSGLSLGLSTGPMSMFGPLFMRILFNEIESGAVETIISVFVTVQSVAFFLGSYVAKKFGVKFSGLISAIIFSLGNVGCAFCVNYIQLLFSYGVLVAFGSGGMFIVGTTCLNHHFTKLRTVSFGLMHTVNMTIATLLPLLINCLIETYGSQSSQLLLSAIAANTIPAALLLRTMKTNRFESDEVQLSEKLLIEDGRNEGAVNLVEDEERVTSQNYRMKSANSKTNFLQSCWKILGGITHSPLFLLFTRQDYIILCLGLALTNLVEAFFFALLPLYLLNHLSTSLEDTSYIMSAIGASDFAGRVFLMVAGRYLSNSNKIIYWITTTMSAALILILVYVDSYNTVFPLVCFLGIARGIIYVTCCLVFAEHYSKELYSTAMGGFGIMSGIINLLVAYLFGMLRDESGGYLIKFTTVVGIMFGISGMWILELIINPEFRRKLCRIRTQ